MKRIFVDQVTGERTVSESKYCMYNVGVRCRTVSEAGHHREGEFVETGGEFWV